MADMDIIYSIEDESETNFINPRLGDESSVLSMYGEDYVFRPQVPVVHEPVVIRGTGNLTLFGLNNKFDTKFPQPLTAKVAPEEFAATMKRINNILRRSMATNLRWFIVCSLICCCTLGCSMWPVVCLTKRTMHLVEKVLEYENNRLYHKLGLHWRFSRNKSDTTSMTDIILLIEFLPKASLYFPD